MEDDSRLRAFTVCRLSIPLVLGGFAHKLGVGNSVSYSAEDLKEQVRTATDIVDVVGSYLELRREGRNYTALCPWHSDSRPSLKINPERQSWKCWVCDVGGDVFSFVMQKESVGFREALELLAERAGIVVQKAGPVAQEGTSDHKPTLLRAVAWAEQEFHKCLCDGSVANKARLYLAERGISEESIKQFHVGFAPDEWQWLIEKAKNTAFDESILEAAGLIAKSEQTKRTYDRFRGRVMFSIRDPQNRAIAFGGRVMPGSDDPAKYINSPETRLFSKSDNVYGLDIARDAIVENRHAVIVEGYTDVIMAHQHGVNNVVAVLGTALGPRHIRLLRRFANRVTLVLDGDEAGQNRTNQVLEMFVSSPLDLRIVTLPDGQDPCDYVQKHGADGFNALLETSLDALTHKINTATDGLDLGNDLHGANQALEDILSTLSGAALGDNDPQNPWRLRMQQVIGRLAREFRVDESHLRDRLRGLRIAKRPLTEQIEHSPKYESLPPFDRWDRQLLGFLFRYPDFISSALDRIDSKNLSTAQAQEVWQICHAIHQSGGTADFGRVLSEVDDPRLKNMLVEVDEEAQVQAPAVPQDCLEQLIQAYQVREDDAICKSKVQELEAAEMTEEEQMAALTELLNRKRQRQGISAPTDG
jgi:DNA primase